MTVIKDLERIKDLENSEEVQPRSCEGGNPFTFHSRKPELSEGDSAPLGAPHAGVSGCVQVPLHSGFCLQGHFSTSCTLPALPQVRLQTGNTFTPLQSATCLNLNFSGSLHHGQHTEPAEDTRSQVQPCAGAEGAVVTSHSFCEFTFPPVSVPPCPGSQGGKTQKFPSRL